MDSTPVSPVARKESWKIKGLGQGAGLGAGSTVGPGEEEDVYGELSGEKGGNEVTREVCCPLFPFYHGYVYLPMLTIFGLL